MKTVQFLLRFFQFVCLCTAFGMAGYWIFKYVKNEDITLVEYKAFKDSDSLNLPAMSICFMDPFLMDNATSEYNGKLNSETYLKYLHGDMSSYQDYKNIVFDQVTLNISDYLDNITVYYHLRTDQTYSTATCVNPNNCSFLSIKNNFNGFFGASFWKCFEITIEQNYSKLVYSVVFGFNDVFERVLPHVEKAFAKFHYPGQLLLDLRGDHILWKNRSDINQLTYFKIESTEILRRRNKSQISLADSMLYDDLIQKYLIQQTGCQALYHRFSDEAPFCDSSDKLEIFNGLNLGTAKFSLPREEMSQLSISHLEMPPDLGFGLYPIMISYPKKMKIITQQQAIDIHALIGNIGGYIGLFLGVFEI